MEITTIEKLKKGDYFKRINSKGEPSKTVYVYEGYCRINRGYVYTRFDDFCADRVAKKGTKVTTDFIF